MVGNTFLEDHLFPTPLPLAGTADYTSNFPRNCPCHPLLQTLKITFVFVFCLKGKNAFRNGRQKVLKCINSTDVQ